MRIFKSELREMQSENKADSACPSQRPAAAPHPVQSQRVDAPAATEQGQTEARPA